MDDIFSSFSDIFVQKQLPSYISAFLTEEPQDVMFVRRRLHEQKSELENSIHSGSITNDSSHNLDITGSPLKFNEYSAWVDDSVLQIKKCWTDDEEKHLPLLLKNARSILSRYLTKVPNCNVPLWVVCDGSDTSKTLILCGFKEKGWCSRIMVDYKGLLPYSLLEKEFDETTSLSLISKQDDVDIHSVFDLNSEESFEKTLDLTQSKFVPQNCKNMLVKLLWHQATLKVPQNEVSATLSMDLNIGHRSSAIYSIWMQLKLLSTYYEILYDIVNDKQPTLLSNDIATDKELLKKTSRKILTIIESPEKTVESFSQVPLNNIHSLNKINENIFAVLTKQIVSCMRPDSDVTDKIWVILNELNDVRSITACLNMVFSELEYCKVKTLAGVRRKTSLSNIISAILKGDLTVTEISVKRTLEVMIENGIEKLKQDYSYVFRKLGVECWRHFKDQTYSIAKSLDIVKYNLNVLSQMHIALDFFLVAHFRFSMMEPKLNILAQNFFKKSCEVITSIDTLQNNSCISLEVPINFEAIVDHLPSNYKNLKIVWHSKDKKIRGYSVLLLSLLPIFPPSIFQCDSNSPEKSETTLMESQYYTYQLLCCCDLVGKS